MRWNEGEEEEETRRPIVGTFTFAFVPSSSILNPHPPSNGGTTCACVSVRCFPMASFARSLAPPPMSRFQDQNLNEVLVRSRVAAAALNASEEEKSSPSAHPPPRRAPLFPSSTPSRMLPFVCCVTRISRVRDQKLCFLPRNLYLFALLRFHTPTFCKAHRLIRHFLGGE